MMRRLALLLTALALACADPIDNPDPSEAPMPYDISDPTSATRYVDGVTPVAANWLNSCVVDFSDQADAIAGKDAPDTVCVSEADYTVEIGGEILAASPDATANLDDLHLASTGGHLLLQAYSTGPSASRVRRLVRRDLSVDETLSQSPTTFISASLATDGELVWKTALDALGIEARAAQDLAAPASVTIALPYNARDIDTNGAQVVVAAADTTTPANNIFRGYAVTGGAALWSIASPWTTALGYTHSQIACDGTRAYLMSDEDSTGAQVRVRAVGITSGATLWTYAPAYEYADATYLDVRQRVVSNGEQLAILLSSRLIVLNAATGAELWTATYADPPSSYTNLGLSLAWGPGGRLYAGRGGASSEDGLYCYDGVTGRLIWSNATISPLALTQDGAGLWIAYANGATVDVAKIAHETGSLLMQRVSSGARHRRPWSKLLIPAGR